MSKFVLYTQLGSMKSNQAWSNFKKIAAAVMAKCKKIECIVSQYSEEKASDGTMHGVVLVG